MSSYGDQASAFFARFTTVRWLARLYRERLTPAGKVLLLGSLAALLLGADTGIAIFYIWCVGFALLAMAGVSSALFARLRVQASRSLPRHVCAGEKIAYEVRVKNLSARPGRDVEVTEQGLPKELKAGPEDGANLRWLPGGSETAVRLGLTCSKRGVYPLSQIMVGSSFPSGLFRSVHKQAAVADLVVYPAFRRLAEFKLPAPRRYQPGGLSMTSDVGDSTEFMSTREYRYGDNIRDIHWASWARTGKPVVKEYQEEYFVRLAMLVDSLVPEGGDDRAFESGVSLAAAVADVLSRQEYIIDIFAAGEEIHRFQAGRALAHFDNILEILACLKSSPRVDMKAVLEALRPESARLSALVCILMDWDPERRALVESLRTLGLAARTVIVRSEPPTLAVEGEPEVVWRKPEEAGEGQW